jgi:tetratricopeptide (TPR) repeat protein
LLFSIFSGSKTLIAQNIESSVKQSLEDFQAFAYVDNEKALYHLKQAEQAAISSPDSLAIVYQKTSDYYAFVADDVDASLLYLNKALQLRSKLTDKVIIAQILNRKGFVLKILWRIEEAFASYNEAIAILENTEKVKELNNSYIKKGRLYAMVEMYTEAFECFDKALQLAKGNPKVSTSYIYRSIGRAYKKKGDFDAAEVYFHKVITLIKQRKVSKKNQAELVRVNTNLAHIAYEKGAYEKALQLVLESEEWIKKVKKKKKLAGVHLLLGQIYFELGNDSLALQYAKKSYQKAVKKNIARSKVEAAKLLALIYKRRQNHEKAYEFLQLHDTLEDKYAKEKGKQALMKASFLQTLADKDKLYTSAKEAITKEKQNVFLTVIFCVGLIGFFFMLYKQKKYSFLKQLENKESYTNRVKENLAATQKKMLQTQNELNAYTRIISQQANDSNDTSLPKMTAVIQQLRNLKILTEDDWLTFKTLFVTIHPDFFKNFKVTVMNYSLGDLKLASLIRLHLNTKEIANILAISPESVRKGKYRLRKKMTLASEKELQKFIYDL